MPIVVRHDPAATGALAALALAMGAGQAEARVRRPTGGGGGRGGGGPRIGGIPRSTPYRPIDYQSDLERLEDQLRAQTYAKVKEAEFMAPIEQEAWEQKYSFAQRKEIQKLNNSIAAVQRSPRFSEPEKASIIRRLRLQQWGIPKDWVPKDEEQIEFEEGREPGKVWEAEDGSWYTTEPETGAPKLLLRFDQTRAGIELKARMERETELSKERARLYREQIEDGVDSFGKPVKRHRRPAEVEALLERMYPWYHEQRMQEDFAQHQAIQEQESLIQQEMLGQALSKQATQTWMAEAKAEGWDVDSEKDVDLPPVVGKAQAILRTLNTKYKGKGGVKAMSERDRAEYLQAHSILEAYRAQLQGAGQPAQTPMASPPAVAPSLEYAEGPLLGGQGRLQTPVSRSGYVYR